MNDLVNSLRYLASLCEKEASDLQNGATNIVALYDLRRAMDEIEAITISLDWVESL